MNSLIMEDKHLDTILKTESDELIKSSVEDLVQILSESEDSSEAVVVVWEVVLSDGCGGGVKWGGHDGVMVGCGCGDDVGGGGVNVKVTRMEMEVATVVGEDGGA
ncbi:hypothetical protein Tco_0073522 [Tanacetum coccineum]